MVLALRIRVRNAETMLLSASFSECFDSVKAKICLQLGCPSDAKVLQIAGQRLTPQMTLQEFGWVPKDVVYEVEFVDTSVDGIGKDARPGSESAAASSGVGRPEFPQGDNFLFDNSCAGGLADVFISLS